eukprot:scaffold3008_cov1771-Pavlova_lutheri.AAC.4
MPTRLHRSRKVKVVKSRGKLRTNSYTISTPPCQGPGTRAPPRRVTARPRPQVTPAATTMKRAALVKDKYSGPRCKGTRDKRANCSKGLATTVGIPLFSRATRGRRGPRAKSGTHKGARNPRAGGSLALEAARAPGRTPFRGRKK